MPAIHWDIILVFQPLRLGSREGGRITGGRVVNNETARGLDH